MLDWIIANAKDVFALYGIVVALCTTIVKLTPTQKDDNVWAKIVKILDFFSTVFTKEDAAKLASATTTGKSKK